MKLKTVIKVAKGLAIFLLPGGLLAYAIWRSRDLYKHLDKEPSKPIDNANIKLIHLCLQCRTSVEMGAGIALYLHLIGDHKLTEADALQAGRAGLAEYTQLKEKHRAHIQ